jgi:hypothetical protein
MLPSLFLIFVRMCLFVVWVDVRCVCCVFVYSVTPQFFFPFSSEDAMKTPWLFPRVYWGLTVASHRLDGFRGNHCTRRSYCRSPASSRHLEGTISLALSVRRFQAWP